MTPRRGLYLLRHHVPTAFEATIYDPMLCLILRGRKEMAFGKRTLRIGAGECALLRQDSHASSIARAIATLRRDFRSSMVVEDLARAVGMSVSSFHEHFKKVTASSPLQYQKGLRLLEARRLLLAGTASVTSAAFEVGYESPTQFSREYARKFGRPPSKEGQRGRA